MDFSFVEYSAGIYLLKASFRQNLGQNPVTVCPNLPVFKDTV